MRINCYDKLILLALLVYLPIATYGQHSNFRQYEITYADTLQLDSLSIYPYSFKVYCGTTLLDSSQYNLDYANASIIFKQECDSKLKFEYRVFPLNLNKEWAKRDTSIIYNRNKGNRDKYLISSSYTVNDVFGGSGLSKSGSISRGVTFGNNQDLGINSTLNLELAGRIAPNLNLLASVSDDNLPIQAEGNTNKLREFDQVFIQVYNDRIKMIAGDFWLYKPKGYFLSYKKRAQGLTVNYQWTTDTNRVWKTQASAALSKGKFQRQNIQGVEGNQGPYRLRGVENEPFIIVLSGTERVYIDGRLLERGQNFDYIVDYNTAEVTFTARNQITKDSRIVIEFQYSDQNYARSLLQTSTTLESDKLDFWINAYSEQDAKNQTLQQELSLTQRQLLSDIGDTLNLARTSSIDSIGYFDNQNLYALIDSTIYDSVLLYTVDPDSAIYRATFEYVGMYNGNYKLKNYNALGKVFEWVEPVLGVPQGDYTASRLIVTPKKKQMISSGVRYKISKSLILESELSYTNNDQNTFSRLDAKDNPSIGAWTRLIGTIPLAKDSIPNWKLKLKVEAEAIERNYSPIEQFRKVEFDRDWNTRGKGYVGNQYSSRLGADFIRKKYGHFNFEGQYYSVGNDYQGLRGTTNGAWNKNGLRAKWNGSYLSSETDQRNEFIRHRAEISKDIGWFRIGYKDDHELNRFRTDVLEPNSYQFFDYQFYIANSDSVKNKYKIFYRERYDNKSDSTVLRAAAKARSVGGEVLFSEWKNQRLNIVTSYRELTIKDSTLINQSPENTLLGRIEYEFKLFKSALTFNNFYEIGSGLELKREFLYIQVNDGQGVYTWIDYNGDGVKDLNEFEIAQFVDQASYIRVFVPSNEYVKSYSNEYNQSIYWRPERIWARKKGFLKFVSRFSDQARVRIKRKTNHFSGAEAFNPFTTKINDTSLISTSSNIRNSLFFNRTSSIYGATYNFADVRTKTLLASGFDSRMNSYHELTFRWNIAKKFTLKTSSKVGDKRASADYTSGRDYSLKYYYLEPTLIYQPNTVFRVSLDGRMSEKRNDISLGGEIATVMEIGTKIKYSQPEKGSLQCSFNVLNIRYDGQQNSALGFEMLEALKPGINYTWNFGYQRTISKNLQLSILYNGRKSEDNNTIHSGGMEVRAFF